MLKTDFDKLPLPPPQRQTRKEVFDEERQYNILYRYASCNWKSFRVIQMKHVILMFILEEDYTTLEGYAKEYGIGFNNDFKAEYEEMHRKRMEYYEKVSKLNAKGEAVPDDDNMYQYYFYEVPKLYEKMEALISKDRYNTFMRSIGENIRSSGKGFDKLIEAKNSTRLSERVNLYIKMLRRRNIRTKEGVRVVIRLQNSTLVTAAASGTAAFLSGRASTNLPSTRSV